MFKGLQNMASLMRQAQQMSGRMRELQEQLKTKRVRGAAGGGMVEVEVNGLSEVLQVKIDPALVERRDREMIEDLLPAAINDAQNKAHEMQSEAMQSVAEGLDMSGLQDMLSQIRDEPPSS